MNKPNFTLSVPDLARVRDGLFFLTIVIVFLIALFSFIPSYSSLYNLAINQGFTPFWAAFFPLILDGAVLAANFSALYLGLNRFSTAGPRCLLWFSSAFSVCFNVAHAPSSESIALVLPLLGWQWQIAQIMAAGPPILLLLTFELLMHIVRRRIELMTDSGDMSPPTVPSSPDPSSRMKQAQDRKQRVQQAKAANPTLTKAELAEREGVDPRTIQRDLNSNPEA